MIFAPIPPEVDKVGKAVLEPAIKKIKAVKMMSQVYKDQIIVYRKKNMLRLGYLIDFDMARPKDGLKWKAI